VPAKLEHDLKKEARKLGKKGKLRKKKGMSLRDAEDSYSWGTMRKIEKRHRAKGGAPGKYMHNVNRGPG
jgi:hypothetical protein